MSNNNNNTETIRKTITMSYDNFESAIISFLYSLKVIPESWDVIHTDFGVNVDDDGCVEIALEMVKPITKSTSQLTLPLEVFNNVSIKN